MSSDLIIIGTAVLVAANCASLGAFLVLRQMAMMSDAISHAVLLGIVIACLLLVEGDCTSNCWRCIAGILTVSLVEMLYRTGKLKQDSSIGIVFPFLLPLV